MKSVSACSISRFRPSPATGGRVRCLTISARSRKRATMASTSNSPIVSPYSGAAARFGPPLRIEPFEVDPGVVDESHRVGNQAVPGHLDDLTVHLLDHPAIGGVPGRLAAQLDGGEGLPGG